MSSPPLEHVSLTGFGTTEARMLMALTFLFIILATLAVAGRFVSRWLKGVKFALDDWLMLAALIFYYAQGSVNIAMTILGGVGYHIENLGPGNIAKLLQLLAIVQFPYGVTMTLIRCSICMLLIRIFFTNKFRYTVYCIIFLNIAWCIFVIVAAAAICTPFAFNWDKTIEHGKCGNQDNVYVAIAAWAIICDIFMWALPFPVVWKLQLPLAQKIALSGIFALGLIDIIISIFRIVNILNIDFTGDLSFTLADTNIWSVSEPSVAILVGNGPILRPVFEKLTPTKFLAWTRSSFTTTRSTKSSKIDNYGKINEDQFELVKSNLGSSAKSNSDSKVTAFPKESYIVEPPSERPDTSNSSMNAQHEYIMHAT